MHDQKTLCLILFMFYWLERINVQGSRQDCNDFVIKGNWKKSPLRNKFTDRQEGTRHGKGWGGTPKSCLKRMKYINKQMLGIGLKFLYQ